MQAAFFSRVYFPHVPRNGTILAPGHLRQIREAAGLSQRKLATLLGVHHSNISYWERSGHLPPGDLLPALAIHLGVSVEQIVGMKEKPATTLRDSRARRLFEAVSKLPKRQQDKILSVVEAFVKSQGD